MVNRESPDKREVWPGEARFARGKELGIDPFR